jgi:hypothetical protein
MTRCANIYCCTTENITQHHLIPKPFRKGWVGRIPRVHLCEDCHKQVHRLATNTRLAREYNTRESVIELLANDISFRIHRFLTAA